MNDSQLKKGIEATLKLFPEVNWDRWSGELADATIFGWVEREDQYKDYVELCMWNGEPDTISTSSAKYSAAFSQRLGFTNHSDCRRVENDFSVPNVIHLKKARNA